MVSMQIVQAGAAMFAILAAWAWLKSAFLSLGRTQATSWIDGLLNRISTHPNMWNAIAAGLAAVASVLQAVAYLFTYPPH